MRTNFLIRLLICFQISSCGFFSRALRKDKTLSGGAIVTTFNLVDKSGKFELRRESGYIKSKNQYITKRQIFSYNSDRKLLEKSIVISTPGSVKGVNVMRPSISQYTVWFEKKKYFTEMEISPKDKSSSEEDGSSLFF